MHAIKYLPIILFLTLSLGLVSQPLHAKSNAPQNAPQSFATLAEQLLPSVVNVSSTQKIEDSDHGSDFPELPNFPEGSPFQDFFEDFMGKRGQGSGPALPSASLGSGFIIDAEKGYIITNNHVIKGAEEVRVTLHDDSSLPAKIIGRDEKVDIAVLQVETKKKLHAVKFGNSDVMRVGDWIVAIGNPFGLGGTVTAGIISARQRDINSGPYDDYIQTDASINRGNSGGPMFNLDGEIIGINTAIFSPSGGSVGIGFAIPSNLAQPLIDQIVKYGRTRRGWLGVRIQTVTDEIADSLGLKKTTGALIASVTEDGPAEKSKLKTGDIILTFDGKDVDEMKALPRIVAETPIEKDVIVEFWRDGKKRKTRVKIGELEKAEEEGLLSQNTETEEESDIEESEEIKDIGLSVSKLTDETRDAYNVEEGLDGVLITEVDRKSHAAKEGILEGDVIVEMNQQEVNSAGDIKNQIHKAKKAKRSSVLLLLNREGDVRFIALKLNDAE